MSNPLITIPELMPLEFADSIECRVRASNQFRVGNPYRFINAVGIEAIIEQFCQGNNIVEVAKKLNVSVVLLIHWIEAENHGQRIEEAVKISAEGYLAKAASLIMDAPTDFHLKKARELAKLNTFIASKVNRKKYGQEVDKTSSAVGVQFVMHIGNSTTRTAATGKLRNVSPPPEMQSLEGVFMILPTAGNAAQNVAEPDDIGPFEEEPYIPHQESMPSYLNPLSMKDVP